MSNIDEKIYELHDRRLNDHEARFNEEARVSQEIKDTLKQLMERINEGVSKTQQRILEENKAIEIGLKDLAHSVEITNIKLNDKIDTIHASVIKRIEPLEESSGNVNKIYVWGVLGGLILGIIGFATSKALEKLFPKERVEMTEKAAGLKSHPARN